VAAGAWVLGISGSGDLEGTRSNQVDWLRQQDVKLFRAIWIRFDWRHTPGSAQRIYDPRIRIWVPIRTAKWSHTGDDEWRLEGVGTCVRIIPLYIPLCSPPFETHTHPPSLLWTPVKCFLICLHSKSEFPVFRFYRESSELSAITTPSKSQQPRMRKRETEDTHPQGT